MGQSYFWGAVGRGPVCVQMRNMPGCSNVFGVCQSPALLLSFFFPLSTLLAVVDRKPASPVGKSPDPLNTIHGLSIPASSS